MFRSPPPRALGALLFALAALGGCARDAADSGARAPERGRAAATLDIDDFGDTLRIEAPARRVVSLNPTTTEIIFAIGGEEQLVGRSRWDEWPAAAKAIPALGDGIRPNVEAVLAARPDLVVLYASADNRAAAQQLRAQGVRTLALKVDEVAAFRRAARLLGAALGRADAARATVDTVSATLERVRRVTRGATRPSVVWRAWGAPLLVIGGGSYFTELLDAAGGRNVFADLPAPSPQVSFEEVLRRDPDLVVGGPEEVAKLRADPAWRTLRAVREGRVLVVDDALVGRPSVRIGEAAVMLARALHPELRSALDDRR